MRFVQNLMMVLLAALVLSGCAGHATRPPLPDGPWVPVNSPLNPAWRKLHGNLTADEVFGQADRTVRAESVSPPVIDHARVTVPVFVTHFAFNQARLSLDESALIALLTEARQALVIDVRGRTDGTHWSAGDEHVALQRALAMRDLLVQHGIPAAKIRLNALSGGDYVDNNHSVAGRAQNRRVEVHFEGVAS